MITGTWKKMKILSVMSMTIALMTGIGLAADASAVAAARALGAGRPDWRQSLRLGIVFGVFQGVMPLLGAGLALVFLHALAAVDHWIAFALLAGIGVKLGWDAWRADGVTVQGWPDWPTLMVLGVATSIDAAAAGAGLATLGGSLWMNAGIIAVVTFVLATLAAGFAPRLGPWFGRQAGFVGAVILIGLGGWILISHLRDHG